MTNILASGFGHIHFSDQCNGCVFSSTDGWHCTAPEEEEKFHILVDAKNNAARCSGYISGS